MEHNHGRQKCKHFKKLFFDSVACAIKLFLYTVNNKCFTVQNLSLNVGNINFAFLQRNVIAKASLENFCSLLKIHEKLQGVDQFVLFKFTVRS